MATYRHFEAVPPLEPGQLPGLPPMPWTDVLGSDYTAHASFLHIENGDGTLTIAYGSFNVVGNTVMSGTITSLDHRGTDGTIYEEITGTSINASQFLAAAPEDRLALAFAGSDDLTGFSGTDFLDGHLGTNRLAGGLGDDYYYVGAGIDTIVELPNQGNDTVVTNLSSYTLGANLENLSYTGGGWQTGYGNNLDNVFQGNTIKNTSYGYGGNDYFSGGGTYNTFVGGIGNDSYEVGVTDTVTEAQNEGVDTVLIFSPIANYVLPANVENLVGTGTGTASGNELDNWIRTNGGSANLYGLAGNDLINVYVNNITANGGDGDDTLAAHGDHITMTGGAGDDLFVIQYSGNNVITDFTGGAGVHDRIDLQAFRPGGSFAGANPFHNLADVFAHATQNGADTVIDLGAGSSLTLQNVQKFSLSADDFIWSNAARDFNGDDHSDALLIGNDGRAVVWDGANPGGAHQIADTGTIANSWHFFSTGDFDGNGQKDILWVNDNGAASIWDNGQVGGAHIIASAGAVSSSWHLAGTGDFDGNNKSDILWVNDNGAVSVWDNGQMANAHVIAPAGTLANSGWHFAGTGDFSGNGTDDILWHNDNGAVSIWNDGMLNQAHIIASAGKVPADWHIAGVGDYDGNNHDDILWHNDNGSVSVWDNGQISSAHIVGIGVDASWHIA